MRRDDTKEEEEEEEALCYDHVRSYDRVRRARDYRL